MRSIFRTTFIEIIKRHYRYVMAFVVGVGVVCVGWLVWRGAGTSVTTEVPAPQVIPSAAHTFSRSLPTRLIIPKMNLDTTFVKSLSLNADRTIEVPEVYDKVGWYNGGVSPGEVGPSVILGHVDSYQGPAIFYHLGILDVGDEIVVERADGTTATFMVTDKERVSQDDFPTERVYGPLNHAGLRLVTCTGTYNKGTLKYSHNLIVYAKLKE
ncbi:MAG TPA: class F sortase [Candidatus Paceibacterota bacterium]|nr:class F sortase [Candidatus Paceibacterota bacterium]